MARIYFCGFDYALTAAANSTLGSGTQNSGGDPEFAVPTGTTYLSRNETEYSPTQAGFVFLNGASGRGGTSVSSGFGIAPSSQVTAYYANDTLNARIAANTAMGVLVSRSSLGNPDELFISFDYFGNCTGEVNDPGNLMRSERPYQIFQWGDLSIRIRSVTNFLVGPSRCDWTYELFNGVTSLGTLTVPNVGTTNSHWQHFRIRAKLASGTAGRLDLNVDGFAVSVTGIDSVQSTSLVNATKVFVGIGALGRPTAISGPTFIGGCIDNLLMDNQSFATFRPYGVKNTIANDATVTGWVASGGGTLTSAVSATDANLARGTGQGSRVTFNPTAVVTTGFANNVLGFYHVVGGASNVDVAAAKRIRTGIELNAIPSYGSDAASKSLPLTPSLLNGIHDAIFYRANGAEYVLSDLPQCRPLLEVV